MDTGIYGRVHTNLGSLVSPGFQDSLGEDDVGIDVGV